MCMKLPLGDLNPGLCPPHLISIYICGVTTAPRVCGGTSPRDGNEAGRGGAEGWDLCPHPTWIFLAPSPPCPAPHDGENFLPHPRPLRPHEAPPYIVKLYFLLIFPAIITIFSNKMTYFNNKNILKIINKFILSNQTNF